MGYFSLGINPDSVVVEIRVEGLLLIGGRVNKNGSEKAETGVKGESLCFVPCAAT